jgi:hypothetical protein
VPSSISTKRAQPSRQSHPRDPAGTSTERVEVSHPPTQIEFEVPWRPKTQLAGLRQQLGGLGPTERGTERRLGRRELTLLCASRMAASRQRGFPNRLVDSPMP